MAATLAHHRDHSEYRSALVVGNFGDAVASLSSISMGRSMQSKSRHIVQKHVFSSNTRKDIVFVFSGHGAQWAGMGKKLLRNTEFLAAVLPLDAIVQREIQQSPIELLGTGEKFSTDTVQILTYLMQIGICRVLESRGIVPAAIIGHSVGEVAASVVAGTLTPEEGTLIVTRRSVLYRSFMGKGAMVMVNKGFLEMAGLVAALDDPGLVPVIDASPSSCVVAGTVESVYNATKCWKTKYPSIKIMNINTDIAFHSPVLQAVINPLLDALEGTIHPTSPSNCKLYSTASSNPREQSLRDPVYWVHNTISPVRLRQAVQAALEDSFRIFVEISSHPIVTHAMSEIMLDGDLEEWCVIPTLQRNADAEACLLTTMAELHCVGVNIDWSTSISAPWTPDFPVDPWLHQPVWHKSKRREDTSPVLSLNAASHDPLKHTLLGKRSVVPGTGTALYSTQLNSSCRPFPESHPVLGAEIIPAAVLFNTFFSIPNVQVLENVCLRMTLPVPEDFSRAVQVTLVNGEATIASQLMQPGNQDDDSWTIHTTAGYKCRPSIPATDSLDLVFLREQNRILLATDFSVNYLSSVGVTAMAFPWVVREHLCGEGSMLCRVHAVPSGKMDGAKPPWSRSSWAPLMDAATSVGSTIFETSKLRMPTHVQRIETVTREDPPIEFWLYIELLSDKDQVCNITIADMRGNKLLHFLRMTFSGIEDNSCLQDQVQASSESINDLVHQMTWIPAPLAASAHWHPAMLVIVTDQADLHASWISSCKRHLGIVPLFLSSHTDLERATLPHDGSTAILYVARPATNAQSIFQTSQCCTWELLEILKFVCRRKLDAKVFAFAVNTESSADDATLACAPLMGLCRVLASEHPEQFGCLVDAQAYDSTNFDACIESLFHVRDVDIVRIQNGLPTVARLQPLTTREQLSGSGPTRLLPRAGGTYLITGGLGALGLEVASFLVRQGARRLILVSRRQLPVRSQWSMVKEDHWSYGVLARIKSLEGSGATVHSISLDIADQKATDYLQQQLETLSLPSVAGVVHAAGVVENQLALHTTQDAFHRVLAPKIQGALTLHKLFPPGSIDFMVLFSSCGQLVGFTGQSSYASGNAFLDALATHRQRHQGDTSVSFLWTSWRDMGMVASSSYIALELESKGITDVSRDEAFAAWMHVARHVGINHAVVLRARTTLDDGMAPLPILEYIVRRTSHDAPKTVARHDKTNSTANGASATTKAPLARVIQTCVAEVLRVGPDDVDPKASLTDLGMDSVMMVMLRRLFQQSLKIKTPPTLIWRYPTVNMLVEWFTGKLAAE